MNKYLKIWIVAIALGFIHQFAAAQNCQGNKVRMSTGSKGHGCHCKSKCVDPAEVATYQANYWYIGECYRFCPNGWRIGEEPGGGSETSFNEIAPNPASGSVTIYFSLAQAGEVSIDVYDLAGRFIKNIVNSQYEEDANEVSWNTGEVSPGIYLIRLKAGPDVAVQRISVAAGF